jgi:hypothetical protein
MEKESMAHPDLAQLVEQWNGMAAALDRVWQRAEKGASWESAGHLRRWLLADLQALARAAQRRADGLSAVLQRQGEEHAKDTDVSAEAVGVGATRDRMALGMAGAGVAERQGEACTCGHDQIKGTAATVGGNHADRCPAERQGEEYRRGWLDGHDQH